MEKATTQELGRGFRHHGVATPYSNHRGTVATVDGNGRNVVLVWLFDHRGGYAILVIDAETGESQEVAVPFPPGGDCPYASILSSNNRYYTHFNSYFSEFDPSKRAFTFHQKTAPQMAMSMAEDDDGRIWSATYPSSGLVSFDPREGRLEDYGHLYDQDWRQYPRAVAADDAGWVYFGVGSTAGQIVAFDRQARKAVPLIPEEKRAHGYAHVYRDLDGKVYGRAPDGGEEWVELYRGKLKAAGPRHGKGEKPVTAGSQGLFHREFPDGKRVKSCDLVERTLVVEDPKAGTERTLTFDYSSEGAHIMGVAVAPDGTVCGGTAFPMRFFCYDPRKDAWDRRAALGQWNTVARQNDLFFVGAYTHGLLEAWDPARPWAVAERGKKGGNPELLFECGETINRPHALLPHADGKTVVMGGTPGYGLTGGGLLIWDRATRSGALLEHTDLLTDQSTVSLASLPDGKVLGGSTTSAGTGGQQKAKEAELYILDLSTRKMEWHEAVLPEVQGYTALGAGPEGLIYGFADRRLFFVFDPRTRKVVHQEDTGKRLGPCTSQQGPRVFTTAPDGTIHVLFVKGVGRIDPASFRIDLVAESPVPIQAGGDTGGGRIYFASGSHLYSYGAGN